MPQEADTPPTPPPPASDNSAASDRAQVSDAVQGRCCATRRGCVAGVESHACARGVGPDWTRRPTCGLTSDWRTLGIRTNLTRYVFAYDGHDTANELGKESDNPHDGLHSSHFHILRMEVWSACQRHAHECTCYAPSRLTYGTLVCHVRESQSG